MNIDLCDRSVPVFHEIDNSLVGFEILSPDRSVLAARQNPDAHKSEQRQQNPAGMLEDVGIV
jgi:hypothetical protein